MRKSFSTLLAVTTAFCVSAHSSAQLLGTANTFAVLAGASVTNTGSTVINGDLGVWPSSSVMGFPPGVIENGAIHPGDTTAQLAEADLVTAYSALTGETVTQDLTGQNLGGLTLTAGVYKFSSSSFLTGDLTLDAQGNPNARFDFLIGSTLITASGSSVKVINGGDGRNVYWGVGSSATLGTGTAFEGNILASASITVTTGATILDGSALAMTGSVTMDSNSISISPVPEPSAVALVGLGLLACMRRIRR